MMSLSTPLLNGTCAILLLSTASSFISIGSAKPTASFPVLTYNVAGLPMGLPRSFSEGNHQLFSPLLNAFDLAAVQENFGRHDDLISQVDHPHLGTKATTNSSDGLALGLELGLGVGLVRLPKTPSNDFQRVEEDIAARQIQLRQLDVFIEAFSKDLAAIVIEDANSFHTREGDILPEFLQKANLRDVWVEIVLNGIAPAVEPRLNACAENGMRGRECEQKDKIFFPRGGTIELQPIAYDVPSVLYSDAACAPLSDHEPISATFEFNFTLEAPK